MCIRINIYFFGGGFEAEEGLLLFVGVGVKGAGAVYALHIEMGQTNQSFQSFHSLTIQPSTHVIPPIPTPTHPPAWPPPPPWPTPLRPRRPVECRIGFSWSRWL